MIGTWLTHLFGGSAGREGVAVQIGATLSHALGRKLNFPENGRIMLVIGMAAGFGGLFQTPLSATFFAIEVIVIGKMDYEALLPALASAYIAAFTSHSLGLEKFSVAIKNTINLTGTKTIISVIILGILFGLTGRLFSFSLSKLKVFMGETIMNQYLRIGVMAIPLAALLFIIHGSRYSGLGTNIISAGFAGQTIYSYDWLLKLLFTIFTLAIGFQGGEVTPLFSIGTSLGVILGGLLGLPPMLCAALGYAAVFGSATNTLIAPIMIGLEVFGGADMVLFVIVCVIAYGVNGNISIYAQEKFNFVSWPTVDFEYMIKINKRSEEQLEFSSRFYRSLIRRLSLRNSPSKVLKTVLFEAQTTHQVGCESVKTWQNSNAALPIVYLFLSYT